MIQPCLHQRTQNFYRATLCSMGGSKNRNPRNPPKFTKQAILHGLLVRLKSSQV